MKNKNKTHAGLDLEAEIKKNQPPSPESVDHRADSILAGLDAVYAAGPPPESTSQAIQKLRRSLSDTQPIYYQSLKDTPLGDLYVAVGQRGLKAVDFGIPEGTFIDQVTQETGTPPVQSTDHTAEAARQIQDYLDGGQVDFDLLLDLETLTEFQREVLFETARIPRGQVTTYGEIARRIGQPRAARAVGQALGKNPVPIVIPCHRVISGDGTLGGYSGGGGLESKTHLLQLEGAPLMI